MTGNLTPEYRTDKNGHRVLRYVRNEKQSAASAALTSAPPVLPSSPVFNEGMQRLWNGHEISNSGYSSTDFDPKAVVALNRFFATDSEHEAYHVVTALQNAFYEMLGYEEEEEGRTSVHNIAAFIDDLHLISNARSALEGLYRDLGYKDYLLQADEDERRVALSVMKLCDRIGSHAENWEDFLKMETDKYSFCVVFSDKEMLALAIDHANRIDDLLALVEEDKPMPSAEVLRGWMEHEQKPFATGVL